MSYYGYVAPDITKEVNWAKIGTDFADMLNKGEADREAKRKEIDAETDKVIKAINETPQGQHQGIKEWSLKFGSSASKQMLMLNKELKAGRLRPDDFIRYRQNLKDGTDSIYNLAKTYQAEYAKKEELKRKGELSYADSYLMAMTESLGQFSETEAYINPVDSKVYLAKLKNGVVDTNPYNLQSPSVLTGLLTTTYEKFKVMDEAKKVAQAAGNEIKVMGKGLAKRIKDIRGRKDLADVSKTDADIGLYMRLEDAAISAALYNDDRIMSVLTDSKNINPKTGNVYDLTTDPKDPGIKSGDKIYMEFDKGSGRLVPKPTKEQRDVAEDVMRDAIRYQLDYEEEARPEVQPRTPSQWEYERGESARKNERVVSEIAKIYYGQGSDLQEALEYFGGLLPNVQDLDKKGGQLIITYDDGSKKPISIKGKTIEQFIRSATALTGIADIDQALRSARYPSGATYNPSEFKYSVTPAKKSEPNAMAAWTKKVNELVPSKMQIDETEAVQQLSGLTALDFKIDEAEGGVDAIQITSPDGKKSAIFRMKKSGVINDIKKFVTNSMSESELKKLAASGVIEFSPADFNK